MKTKPITELRAKRIFTLASLYAWRMSGVVDLTPEVVAAVDNDSPLRHIEIGSPCPYLLVGAMVYARRGELDHAIAAMFKYAVRIRVRDYKDKEQMYFGTQNKSGLYRYAERYI